METQSKVKSRKKRNKRKKKIMFESQKQQIERIKKVKANLESRLENQTFDHFNQAIKFEKEMNVKGTGSGWYVFSGISSSDRDLCDLGSSNKFFNETTLIRNFRAKGPRMFTVYSGAKKGSLLVRQDFIVPMVHKKKENGEWDPKPKYSFTPNDVFAARPILREVSGTVVLAGLRTGYLLNNLIKKSSVESIFLIEPDMDLFQLLAQKMGWRYGASRKLKRIYTKSVAEVAPLLKADWLLVDSFDQYGNNFDQKRRFEELCSDINKVWCYGSVKI